MTTAAPPKPNTGLRTRPASRPGGRRQHRNRSGGESRLTLATKLAGVWEGLLTTGAAECPVCDGEDDPRRAGGTVLGLR